MKKVCILIFLILTVLYIGVFANTNFLNQKNSLIIGASEVQFDNDFYNVDGMIYVPIRELSEKLCIPIKWNAMKNQVELLVHEKQVVVEDKTKLKESSVIPDEETAINVGKIILEKYVGKSLEYETEKGVFKIRASYHPRDNSWRVEQCCDYKVGGGGGTANYLPVVVLNRNTGEVIFITEGEV